MNNLFEGLDKLQKGGFISIPNYTNSKGEISSYIINGNIDVMKSKKSDCQTLQDCTEGILMEISEEKNIPLDIVRKGLVELQIAAIKNISENKEDRTAASQAQTDAYIQLGKGLKFCKETHMFHIDGFEVSKKVLVEGVYPKVNSQAKTIAKNCIKKKLNLKMNKFRSFKIAQTDFLNMSGMTCQTF